ncbi:hypothetical protein MY4038_004302 [Beauveria bassiana]
MASLNFPAYGSLYFSNAPIESNLKIPLDHEYCIGPNCNSVLWNRNLGEPELYGRPSPNCGPCEFEIVYPLSPAALTENGNIVEPAFIYANETPDFAAPPEEPEEEMPESGQSEQKSPKMRERERKDALICYQTYDVYMKGLIPKWDAAKDAHRAVYDQWIETARELESDSEGLTVEKADKLWPFDAR